MKIFERTCVATAILACSIASATADTTSSKTIRDFNISSQPVSSALREFAAQAEIKLLHLSENSKDLMTRGISGSYNLRDALDTLLAKSNLEYEFVSEDTVAIRSIDSSESEGDGRGRTLDSGKEHVMEEMIVTATKRETSLQDTALSITTMGEDEIENRGLISGEDYLRTVPNVNYIEVAPGREKVVIRGLSTGINEQKLTASYLGEIPVSFSTTLNQAGLDLKLVDLERVEIVRGPQGTLYGSSAMGGIVRSIPNAPKLDQLEGSVEAGVAGMSHSDDLTNNVTGVINVPLIQNKLALRLVGYRFDNAGVTDLVHTPYIDNLAATTGTNVAVEKDVNSNQFTGGRATLLWDASDRLDITLSLGHQKSVIDGRSYSGLDPHAGGYRTFGLVESPGRKESSIDFAHLLTKYDFGWASLTSATSVVEFEIFGRADNATFASVADDAASKYEMEVFTQEIRLSSELDGPLQFAVGVHYEDLDFENYNTWYWVGTQSSLEAVGWLGNNLNIGDTRFNETLNQFAVFGELEYAITEQLSATIGGRWFDYDRQNGSYLLEGQDYLGVPQVPQYLGTEDKDNTFKVGLNYDVNDDVMLYASWAQGFRLGQGQALPPSDSCDTDSDGRLDFTGIEITDSVDSDRTENFELGARMTFRDNSIIANATLYRVDWSDIPVQLVEFTDTCLYYPIVNNGEARSQGVELEVQYLLSENITLSLGTAYSDTQFLNDGIGSKGDRLPLAPKYNGNLGVEYSFNLAGYAAFVRSDYSFSGGVYSEPLRIFPETDSYGLLSLRTGIDLGNFSIQAYVNNLTGEDTILAHWFSPYIVWRVPPRKFGMNLTYRF